MPDGFKEFMANNPVLGIIILVFMALPILGAVAWVVLRALKKNEEPPSE
jgi:hypothetical protein